VVAIPRSVERLIARHVDSVGALDLLLLLHAHGDRDWSADELCEALRCPEGWVVEEIVRLEALDLLEEVIPRHYRYRPGRDFGPAVDEIARACRRDRAAVTRHIFARRPRGRITR
jgi:hypothetical protein